MATRTLIGLMKFKVSGRGGPAAMRVGSVERGRSTSNYTDARCQKHRCGMRGSCFSLTLSSDSELGCDEMVRCEVGNPAILQRDRLQKAESVAKGSCHGAGRSPTCGTDPRNEARLASESDHKSRDVSANEHRRGLQSAKCARVLPIRKNRPQFDDGAGVPRFGGSRPRYRSRNRFIDTHQPGNRSQEDALWPASLSQISLRG